MVAIFRSGKRMDAFSFSNVIAEVENQEKRSGEFVSAPYSTVKFALPFPSSFYLKFHWTMAMGSGKCVQVRRPTLRKLFSRVTDN